MEWRGLPGGRTAEAAGAERAGSARRGRAAEKRVQDATGLPVVQVPGLAHRWATRCGGRAAGRAPVSEGL